MPPVKTETKPNPTGSHPKLPLKGERGGTQRSIDDKTDLVSIPEPEVKEKAVTYAYWLDEVKRTKTNANDHGQELLKALLKSKKTRRITIEGATQTYKFTTKTLTKLFTQTEKVMK